jgi:hypothetical protein
LQKKGDDNSETKKYGSLEISSVKTPSLASTLANLPGLNDSWKTKFLSNYINSVDSSKSATKEKRKGDVVTIDESEDSNLDTSAGDIVEPSLLGNSDDIAAEDSNDSIAMSLEDTEDAPDTGDLGVPGLETSDNSGDLTQANDNTVPEGTDNMDLPLED